MAIKENVTKLAGVLSEHITYNADTHALDTDKDAIVKALPVLAEAGIHVDKKDLDNTAKALKMFTAASALATGELAVDTMAKKGNKDESLTAEWHFATGINVEHTVLRQYEARVPPKEKGGEATINVKHGRLETTLNIQGSKPKSGDLAAIRDAIYERGEEKLK